MKKYLFIGIPCVLLNMASFAGLFISIDAWLKYSLVQKTLDVLGPPPLPKHINEYMEDVRKEGKKEAIVVTLLRNADSDLVSKQEFEGKLVSSAKERFMVFIWISGVATLLTTILILGIAPLFKKGSNNQFSRTRNRAG